MKTLNLWIPGEPKPKQSARFRSITTKSGKSFIHSYQTKDVIQNEKTIKSVVIEQLPREFVVHQGPIIVCKLMFLFSPIKSLKKKEHKLIELGVLLPKTTKPDLTDNLSKGLFDALEGLVYVNDSQICEVQNSVKGYSNNPGIYLELELHENIGSIIDIDKSIEEVSKTQIDLSLFN